MKKKIIYRTRSPGKAGREAPLFLYRWTGGFTTARLGLGFHRPSGIRLPCTGKALQKNPEACHLLRR